MLSITALPAIPLSSSDSLSYFPDCLLPPWCPDLLFNFLNLPEHLLRDVDKLDAELLDLPDEDDLRDDQRADGHGGEYRHKFSEFHEQFFPSFFLK